MKVKNTKVLMPAISVAILALGGGYYGLQLANNQNTLPKALAYTSTINPVNPSTAPDSYEINFTDNNFKRALNSVLMKTDNSRNLDSPITVGNAKKMTTFWPDAPYRNFENLEGIQYLTNLETIHVHGMSSLKDISAAATLTKIKTAYLSSSNISDMSAAKNWKQVGLIWIHDNHVTDFSFLKDLPHAGVWGIRSNVIIKAQKGQRIFKNPFINFDSTIMPIEENENFINVDVNGNPKQDGGYVKIIKPILKGNHGFNIPEKKDALPSGNKINSSYSVSYTSVEGIDVTSLKRDYSPQAGGTFFTATSQTSNITSITSDAEEVFNNKENQINGDYLITVTATNDFENTTTAKFRLLAPFVNREPVKKALENFESQPDYIKKAIPTELVNEANRIKTQSFDITNTQVTNAANSLNNKITEIVLQENEYKADVANAIPEMNKNFDNLEDFKDIFTENSKILEQSVKEANLKELNKLAERYAKNAQKFEDILDKIINLQNIDKYSKETLKKLQEVMQAAEHVNVSTKLKTAEALAKSTENLASEADIIGLTNALENALNGLRANKTALNSQIKNFENTPKWLKDEVKAESQKAIEVQKADNPTIKEVQKATEDLKNAIEKAKKAEENRQKEASLKIDEAQNILAENKSKPDELPVIDIEKIEELISKVKDEAKSKELTKKLQDIKDKIKAKEAKIELDKLEAARKKRDAEIAKQRLNSPETGFLREQNQENKATVPVLIGLVSFIVSPVVVLFTKRRNRKMRKF